MFKVSESITYSDTTVISTEVAPTLNRTDTLLMLRTLTKFALIGIGALIVVAGALALLFFMTRPQELVEVDTQVGLIDKTYEDASRNRILKTFMWYPTKKEGKASLINSNALFFGFSARLNAKPSAHNAPLIILSHGSGGNRGNQNWLAVELAKQGAIVVALNHPGSTSRDSAPATNIEAWHRPQDIEFLLNEILEDPAIAEIIDKDRIAIIGHSLGGYTALASGGAIVSKAAFIDYCDTLVDNPDCQFYKNAGVKLDQIDQKRFEQSHKNSKIKAVVALDPAYAKSFKADSLLDLPATLLLTPNVEPNTPDDLQVDYLRTQLSEVGHKNIKNVVIDGAHHFSFLPICKPFSYYILGLVERGAEALCIKETGVTRRAIQESTTQEVITFLIDNDVIQAQ